MVRRLMSPLLSYGAWESIFDMHDKFDYRIAAVYDTETTNVGDDENTRAFPILFIVNDIRGVDLREYHVGTSDSIRMYRTETEMLHYIDVLVRDGISSGHVPIICAYNLMFDLQPLMHELRKRYKMHVTAQSSTHVYTLDLCSDDDTEKPLLRFWDTYYLEMRGLEAMGETCGLHKAKGDWDYDLIRTSKTPLTEDEYGYARRDVQVIPEYLKYLLKANDWLRQSDFGCKVLTKTSLVRQMAKRNIGNRRVTKENGKQITQSMMFSKLCGQELPKTYQSYALRKACFRGGLTFTSAKYAMSVFQNVASLDVTSMHHAFINGRFIPVKFKTATKRQLDEAFDYITRMTVDDILHDYSKPTECAFHMLVRFDNIRLKEGSCFERFGIATIPSAKFRRRAEKFDVDTYNNDANISAEEEVRANGYVDMAVGAEFAFGKLYSASYCYMHVTELELLTISRVYEWDGHECIEGEITRRFCRPPDYVTLQSNMLFGMKDDVKRIMKEYSHGTRYDGEIPDTIPPDIALNLRAGSLDEDFLSSYYTSTVKGMFNSIYGTMAQDVYKPEYSVDDEGRIHVEVASKVTPDNFSKVTPEWTRVLYTYGMRIVGGSRLHLVLAIEMLEQSASRSFPKHCEPLRVLAGDTDSLKVHLAEDITNDMLMEWLRPLHDAIDDAIDLTMERVRDLYPELSSDLHNVGHFEVESCGCGYDRYMYHMEAWNKARISVDYDGKVHLTCAGLSRPKGLYGMVEFCEDMLSCHDAYDMLPMLLGFNTRVSNELSHALQRHQPDVTDMYEDYVTDYIGNTSRVSSHQSIALYDTDRLLGDVTKDFNSYSIEYVQRHYLHYLDDDMKVLSLEDGKPTITKPITGMRYEGVRDGRLLRLEKDDSVRR